MRHCRKWKAAGLVFSAGDSKACNLTVDGTVLACKDGVVLHRSKEGDVYWRPRTRGCCGLSTCIRSSLDWLQNTIRILGRQRESPSAFITPSMFVSFANDSRLECKDRRDRSRPFHGTHASPSPHHARQISIPSKQRKEDQMESLRQPTSPQTERRGAIPNGLRFLDGWMGTPAQWQQVFLFFFFLFALLIDLTSARPASCSNQGRIMMVTSTRSISSSKLIMQSKFSRAKWKATLKAFSCSIMHPGTWSVPLMPSLPTRWSKVRIRAFIFLFLFFDVSKIRSSSNQTSHTCVMASTP